MAFPLSGWGRLSVGLSVVTTASLLTSSPIADAALPRTKPSEPGVVPAPAPELRPRARSHFSPAPKEAASEIRLANGIVFDSERGEPSLRPELRAETEVAPEERVSLLVQVEPPVRTEWLQELEAKGARVEAFVPNYAFLVRIDARDRSAIESLAFVTWVGAYHPAYRISGQERMRTAPTGPADYAILLFSDGDLGAVAERVALLGGTVEDSSDNGINKILRVRLDRARVEDLAAHRDVQWIEPRDVFTTSNSSVQWVDQTNITNNRKVWDNGITGTGQIVMVGDSGIRTSHDMFRDNAVPITTFGFFPTHRKIIAYQKAATNNNILFGDTAGAAYHGTHTSCTFAGNDDALAADARDGIAKGAKIYFLDGGGSDNLILTPGDLNDYFAPAEAGGARVSSNSWGGNSGGAYTINSMACDQFMWNHEDFLICFSNGNAGGANTVGSPASAKNILSSGGTQNGASANLIYSATSRGPTDDNRFKPTVCSPGQGVSSASGSSDAAYQSLSGTSMSCPNLAGSATLARQYFTSGFYPTGSAVPANSCTPSAALLKAMMVNSGVDDFASFSMPDNNIGWGRILLDNVLFFPGDGRRTVILDESDGVATGETREYEIYVADATHDLKVTLVWTDYPSTPAAAINLVNDLDLEVEEGANTYLGNVWSGGQSVTGGTKDSRNVEENVRRASPVVGTYTIRVEGANVPFGPQSFALVVSGGLGGSSGIVSLDAGAYGPGETVEVRVEDTGAGASVTVGLESSTETTPESLVIAGSNGIYSGTFPLTLLAAAGGDGMLSVSDGDLITVRYVDPSPAHTAIATAFVDADDPAITNVSADPADITATIHWDTNTLANSQIEYGTTASLGTFSTLDGGLVTSHSHSVDGLTPETTYFYDVLSRDHQGNLVRDDFGGMHYRFTTGKRADVLLVNADPNTTSNFERYYDGFAATGWTYNLWKKAEADAAVIGDSTTGMRSYKAVWWQAGWEQYPQFENPVRDNLKIFHDGGARIAFVSHDVAWAFGVSGEFSNASRRQWLEDVMHVQWTEDPLTWSTNFGIAGDPISSPYTAGVSYTPHRSGAAGDEVTKLDGTGSSSYVWRNNDALGADDISVRWQNGVANGTPGVGVWGGTPTRVVSMFYEWLNVNAASSTDAARNDILDRTLIWLIGGDHPDATVVSPNGGETFVSSPVSISWTSATDVATGRDLASTRLEYSDDGGSSWSLITSSPGSSPYSWNVSALPTGSRYQVRVVVTDDGTPALCGVDASNADFTIAIPGNEDLGPLVVAGSPGISPNPIVRPDPATLTATVTDALTGGSNVVAAEWSAGVAPAAAGSGTAMSGSFGAVEVNVSAAIDSNDIPPGATSLWVRGRDAAGNWGPAAELPVQVNGDATGVALDSPVTSFAMAQNFPNPFALDTRIAFALPQSAAVDLRVYNVQGRLVKTLVNEKVGAGRHSVNWDGTDESGRSVSSGIYFYRIVTEGDRAERKMVLLK
jgi:hypothetical protein